MIQHRENIIRDKYCSEDLDRELKRDGYYYDNSFIMPFYSKEGDVYIFNCRDRFYLKEYQKLKDFLKRIE